MKHFYFLLISLAFSVKIYGQYYPYIIPHSLENGLIDNGYAAIGNYSYVKMINRQPNGDFPDKPNMNIIYANYALSDKAAVGIGLFNNFILPLNENGLQLGYSFTIRPVRDHIGSHITFSVSTAFFKASVLTDRIRTYIPNDPAFSFYNQQFSIFDASFGLIYFNRYFTFGVSATGLSITQIEKYYRPQRIISYFEADIGRRGRFIFTPNVMFYIDRKSRVIDMSLKLTVFDSFFVGAGVMDNFMYSEGPVAKFYAGVYYKKIYIGISQQLSDDYLNFSEVSVGYVIRRNAFDSPRLF